MRTLIDILNNSTILTEASRGLLFRAKGDRFFKGSREAPEAALIFDRAEYYPKQPGEYSTHEGMMKAYNALSLRYKGIVPVNKPTNANKAFAVIILTDEKTRKPVYFARFFGTIKPNMASTWANSDLKNQFGFQLEKETSLKASYGLKPSDVFVPPARFKNISMLLDAFRQSKTAQPFVPGFEMLYAKKPTFPTFENAEEFYTAIRDDLGEIIGPVALIQGLDCGSGAKAAANALLDGGDYSGSTVAFPSGKTNGLVDSYIVTSIGVEIGISSKGEKGATASIGNITTGVDSIREKGTPEQTKLLQTYENEVKILDTIKNSSAINFPLTYAISKNILTISAADAIKKLITAGAKKLKDLPIDEDVQIELTNLVSYKSAKTHLPNYNIGFHALSSVAELVADSINSNPKFGEACLKFLNSSPIIQLHMSASKKEKNVNVTGFTSKYPPNFKGTVLLDASKNYSATSAGGRMNFSYNGADAGAEPDISEPIATPNVITGKRVSIRPKGVATREPRETPASTGLGRERR